MFPQRLLVIEEHAALQQLLLSVFKDAGYDVHGAIPDDYLYMAQETQPEIVVIGGGRRGDLAHDWEIARVVRAMLPNSVLVLLSTDASAVDEVGRTMRGQQFDAALRKPFQVDEVVHLVAQLSGRESGV